MPIDIDEINLINAAKRDSTQFGKLYELYVDRIFNYVYYRVGNTHDAEDITSNVFIKALRSLGNYRHMGLPFSAWLYRIAHNMVANHHRDNGKVREISLEFVPIPDLTSKAELPETALEKSSEAEMLLRLINDLPAVRQELIILKFVDKMSNAEIGKILRKSEGAIKSLYHRTLLELREKIKHEMPDSND